MTIDRRRFLQIAGSATAAGLLSSVAPAAAHTMRSVWRGTALGARSQIILDGQTVSFEAETIEAIHTEIGRLERVFSLYRSDSALSRLNRDGRLDRPQPDLLAVLSVAERIHTATGGAFDPTVQPLWEALAERQTPESFDPGHIGWRHVEFDSRSIRFARPGMKMTLNGIAQGYITDRIADLLASRGFNHMAVNIGEWRVVGSRKDGTRWPVRIAGREGGLGQGIHYLAGNALAVSSTRGTTIPRSEGKGASHILDPHARRPCSRDRMVAVEAASAVIADGLSTGLCAIGGDDHLSAMQAFPEARVVAAE